MKTSGRLWAADGLGCLGLGVLDMSCFLRVNGLTNLPAARYKFSSCPRIFHEGCTAFELADFSGLASICDSVCCGIFAHGFAREWCDDYGHDYFVAYSCKGRGVCPLVLHPAHGGDSGTLNGPRLSAPAGAPVGALRPEATALLHAA